MGLFDSSERKELERLLEQALCDISKLTEIISRLTQNKESVKMVLFKNKIQKSIIMSFAPLPANQKAPIVIGLVDANSLQPITATSANETEVSDSPSVATVDASNNLVGVSAGSGNLTSTADWTYTDSNTGQPVTVTLSVVTPFTVTAVVTAESVQMVVSLGTPVAQ
jgi:hypothetical protein